MASEKLFEKNLANIQHQTDLFGNKREEASMKDRLGFLPISIWRPNWEIVKRLKKVVDDTGETRKLIKTAIKYADQSIFNPHLAQMILAAYCPKNAKIYDPFAGGGTRGIIASSMGHDYWGIELRQEEVDRIEKQKSKCNFEFFLHCGDSRIIPDNIEKDSFDFSYTCPPYFDLEVYSNMEDDLSNADNYGDFLGMLKECMIGTYNLLKVGAICVWVVGNFRDKQGNLTHFNGDLIRMGKEIGFLLHDEIIFQGASLNSVQRVGRFEANRKIVRVHEYLVIFKKG